MSQNAFAAEICVLVSPRFEFGGERYSDMADVTRRRVIRGGAAVLGATALGFDTVIGGGAASATPSRSDYASSIGKVFEAFDRDGTTRMRLTHADDATPAGAPSRFRSFVLVFEPVDGRGLDDGIYGVRRRGVPTHDLFLSNIGGGVTLQAVVNGTA